MRRGLTIVALIAGCAGTPHVVDAPDAPATVTVLETGAEPRQRVRFELAAHVPERRETKLKVRSSVRTANPGRPITEGDVDVPTLTIVDRLEVTGFTPNGDAVVAGEIVDASVGNEVVAPALRSELAAAIGKLSGGHETWQMAPSGATFGYTFSRTGTAGSDLAAVPLEQIMQGLVVFPDVAIGAGARWQIRSRLKIGPVAWDRTVTYTLRELAGDVVTVEEDSVMTASAQTISVEPLITKTLTSGRMHDAMQLTVRIHRVVPAGTVQSNSELNMSAVTSHGRFPGTLLSELQFSVKALPAGDHE